MEEEDPFPSITAIDRKLERIRNMSCAELKEYLEQNWETSSDGYLTSVMVSKRCQEAVPYLLRQLDSENPESREQALFGLGELGCRECRLRFIEALQDPVEEVRQRAIIKLSVLFRNEADREIVERALAFWDDPASSVALRSYAGAALMYQLNVPHDERGAPAWWNEEAQDLEHPSILRAVEEARRFLAGDAS